jgi:3',5'-cyclic AMP phosphodiesterase CpdA
MDPQPDFVLYGGDLAQLGAPAELELGAQILENLKAPVRMMVGEHDWYLDLGEKWRAMFGQDRYSFDHKGVHFVVLNSVVEADFWTARGLSPKERMLTVAGLDNGLQNPFTVGDEQRAWLQQDLKPVRDDTPVVVFSHSPLYHLYKRWNFWTDDAPAVQQILSRFQRCTVIHGHTHQLLTHRIGNIHFHGLLSTAWPWPYAPEGMPALTVQMNRPDPFNPLDGCGDGELHVTADGLVDKVYRLWNRNPVTVSSEYMKSFGKTQRPAVPNASGY